MLNGEEVFIKTMRMAWENEMEVRVVVLWRVASCWIWWWMSEPW
jgi:hypothetical protein